MAKRAIVRQLYDVDIRLLRIFLTVCECGGLSASEAELNVGRSTISKYVSDLETMMGFRLCNRGPSGFSVTEEGEQVLEAARKLFDALHDFGGEVDNIQRQLRGTLRLGLFDQSTTNPAARVDEAIRLFDAVAPDVELEISIEPPNVIEAKVIDGSMDIGIIPVHRRSRSLHYQSLYSEQMTLYCGKGHPLFDLKGRKPAEMAEVRKHKYAGFGFASPNMSAGQRLGLRCTARVQDEEALSLLIQSGRYIGFLPDHLAEAFLRKRSFCPVAPGRTRYESDFSAVMRKSPQPGRKTNLMLNQLAIAHGEQPRSASRKARSAGR